MIGARVGDGGRTGSARRRESDAFAERMAVAMALSEFMHHSSRGQRKDRAGGEVRVEPHGEVPGALLPQGGSRPPCLGVPREPQVVLKRHFLEHMADVCPFVQILDAPVPQMGEQHPLIIGLSDLNDFSNLNVRRSFPQKSAGWGRGAISDAQRDLSFLCASFR